MAKKEGFGRAGKGNQEGIAEMIKHFDPLERHTFMIRKSTIELLEKMVFESTEKTNKSKLVRKALQDAYS
jgi:hypothetical protein